MAKLSQNNSGELRARINKKLKEEFDAIKEYYGLSNNSEVLRKLVRNEYHRLFSSDENNQLLEVPASG